jgi:phage terminase large subunit
LAQGVHAIDGSAENPVVGCDKGRVQSGIRLLNSMNIFIVEGTPGFWDPEKGEVVNYVFAQDKNGNYLDEPIDDFNHLWDPTRYVVEYLDRQSGGGMERAN